MTLIGLWSRNRWNTADRIIWAASLPGSRDHNVRLDYQMELRKAPSQGWMPMLKPYEDDPLTVFGAADEEVDDDLDSDEDEGDEEDEEDDLDDELDEDDVDEADQDEDEE